MASLRYSAADESDDTLNSFTSHTRSRHNCCDHSFINSKEAVEPDQDRQSDISMFVNRATRSSIMKELMEELLADEGAKFTPIGDRSKQIMKEQGIIEASEILELSNEVQCQHCFFNYMPQDTYIAVVDVQSCEPIQIQLSSSTSSVTSSRSLNCSRRLLFCS